MMLMLMMTVAVTLVAASPVDESDEENALFAADDDSSNDSDTSAEDDDTDEELTRVARSSDSTVRQRERGQGRREGKAKGHKKNGCRYTKGPWSDCDTTTNQRSRSLTLKKGDASCEQTKSITKPCKKAKSQTGRRNRN